MRVFLISLLLSLQSFATSYNCDLQKDFHKKDFQKTLLIPHNSETYRAVYTGLHQDFENTLSRITEFLKLMPVSKEKSAPAPGPLDVRQLFSQTDSGRKLLTELEKLKNEFGYNSVDDYLFGDHSLNSLGPVQITHIYKKEDRIYYLNNAQIIGFFDQVGEEGVLSRLDNKCEVSELVAFSTLKVEKDSIRMKVSKKYCTSAQNKGPTFKHTDADLKEMGAYFLNSTGVEDQLEAEELCKHWLPPTEPFGLVINAQEKANASKKPNAKKKKTKK